MKMDISWDGHWPKQASQTEGSSSWWLPNKLSDSWSCPETVAKPADLILVRAEGVCMVKRGSISCTSGSCGQQGFSRAVQSLRDLHFILYSPQSSGLVSNKVPGHQLQGSNAASCRLFPLSVCMKYLYKNTDPAIPPDKSSCTLHVSWSSVDDAWENICERAEGLRGARLLSSKGQQQGLCWSFAQNLHHSRKGWTR